jgi:predicted peptidase
MAWDLDTHGDLPYRFHVPVGYDPSRERYPLVIYLHGYAERGHDTWAHMKNGVETLARWPAIAVAPQCPDTDTWGGSWYGGDSRAQRQVVSLVEELGQRRSVDPDRVVLIGYSMGAIGLWAILERDAALFSAAVPIAGDLRPESARSLLHFAVWAFHGEKDDVVSNLATRKVAAMSKEAQGAIRYTELPGVGHESWKAAFASEALKDWCLAQRRSARST